MKTIIKEKIVEIIIGLIVSTVIVLTGFYYTTQSDINYLKIQSSKNCEAIKSVESRMNRQDVLNREISIKLDYISIMLEEIKGDRK